jgi:hypothetical protein
MSRLNWNDRQAPTDFDNTAPKEVDYSFDHRRNLTPGASSWPEKFGPNVIRKAWANGLVVIAELEEVPHPVAVTEARWVKGTGSGVLQVKTLGNWLVPQRLYTRSSLAGLKSTGELVE